VSALAEERRPRPGLRERKKAKTRAAIREHALRLVREQGYAATTVEQIAAAADVSPSTFFRYFPTKEDAVLYDPYDRLMIEAFRTQPADLSPIQALRRATRGVFAALPADELAKTRDLLALVFAVAELRVRMLDELARSAQLLAELVAERTGRRTDELAVQTFAGALVGATMAVMSTAAADPEADVLELMDSALGLLERGLPL
jgi:AcrR family transcriptional regulator